MLKRRISVFIMTVFLCSAMTACTQEQSGSGSESKNEVSASVKFSNNEISTEQEDKQSVAQESEKQNSEQSAAQESEKQNSEQSAAQETEKQNSEQSAAQSAESAAEQNQTSDSADSDSSSGTKTTPDADGLDSDEIFTSRDLEQEPDLSSAKSITVSSNDNITISEEGIYVISGTAENCTIRVEAGKDAKVQLVLDGVSITNSSTPAIYVVSADKCFITSAGSNSLSVTGAFTSDGDTNTDAVIFSKDDIVLNGTGSLSVNSAQGNGISGKDDVKITGGIYTINSAKDSIEANDSIAVCGGSFTITSSKDAFHSENDDDNSLGWIYISGGTFDINAASDSIQATTLCRIDGGDLTLRSSEGIEATYVQINDGKVSITASDDGINASKKSSYSTPTVEINGGSITIVMGQGDTDAIDANGNIIVNGGTINITAQVSSFDYDGTAQYNGGTIIINGSQVDSIPQSMMGGGMRGMGRMGGMRGQMF